MRFEDFLPQMGEAASSPITPVPSSRWGGKMQPVLILNDESGYQGFQQATCEHMVVPDIDIEGGKLFVAGGRVFAVYDVASNPASPFQTEQICGQGGLVADWIEGDKRFYLNALDAPEGNSSVVAMSGDEQGFIVFRTSISPARANYQDSFISYTDGVYSVRAAGRDYAYATTESAGIWIYDLTTAAGLGAPCLRSGPSDPCGAFKGTLATPANPEWIRGAGSLLAVNSVANVRIFDISASPTAPALRINATTDIPSGLEVWRQGATYYLGVLASSGGSSTLKIFDVSCAAVGTCSLPAPLSTTAVSAPSSRLTFMRRGTAPYLYVAWAAPLVACASAEFVYDVSNPLAPVEMSPNVPNQPYWRWYHSNTLGGCTDGFRNVLPSEAAMYDDYLYRGGGGVLDIHRILTQPPLGITTFQATCGASCFEGNPISFSQSFTGSPTTFEYDWEGDGTYEQSGGTPDTSNTYPHGVIPRSVAAKIRISDGVQQATATAPSFTLQCNPSRTVPPEPAGLAANPVAPTLVNLTWSDVANEYQYRAERLLESGSYQLLQTLPENTTFYQATGLTSGLGYWFDVRASSCAGTSPGATPVYAVTPAASDVFSSTFEPGEPSWDHFSPP